MRAVSTDGSMAAKAKSKARKSQKQQRLAAFRQFTSPGGFPILVGRSNRQNDELTHSIAKPADTWLHARGVPGELWVIDAWLMRSPIRAWSTGNGQRNAMLNMISKAQQTIPGSSKTGAAISCLGGQRKQTEKTRASKCLQLADCIASMAITVRRLLSTSGAVSACRGARAAAAPGRQGGQPGGRRPAVRSRPGGLLLQGKHMRKAALGEPSASVMDVARLIVRIAWLWTVSHTSLFRVWTG